MKRRVLQLIIIMITVITLIAVLVPVIPTVPVKADLAKEKAKKLIVYMGGTSSAYRGFQIKKGKLVITNAFQCKKIWKKSGNFNLSYYVNGKKVSEKKYNNKMNTLKNVKIKKYK